MAGDSIHSFLHREEYSAGDENPRRNWKQEMFNYE